MKISILIPTLVFLLCITSNVFSQTAITELQKLETQLKELDKDSNLVDVKVKGKENSGKINIVVEREVPGTTVNTTIISNTKKKKVTLPTIDLSKLEISDEYINNKMKEVLSSKAQCGELPGVNLTQVGVSQDYEVIDDYIYNSGTYTLTVLKGFRYDRASIPRVFWAIIDKDSLGNVAPLLHDVIYRHGGVLPRNQISPYKKFSRKETDDLFLLLMEKCGVTKVRRELAYQAVRRFAGLAWRNP